MNLVNQFLEEGDIGATITKVRKWTLKPWRYKLLKHSLLFVGRWSQNSWKDSEKTMYELKTLNLYA
jgi:hypothetical protein